ncbi:BufA1 family periplasmic bufferin-type metallophore [Legionella sp. WA2022007384]
MNKRKMQNSAVIAAALSASLVALYTNTDWLSEKNQKEEFERCYGVVRVNKNDCATSKHSCAAQATKDGDPEEFIMLPKGLCDRILGEKSA